MVHRWICVTYFIDISSGSIYLFGVVQRRIGRSYTEVLCCRGPAPFPFSRRTRTWKGYLALTLDAARHAATPSGKSCKLAVTHCPLLGQPVPSRQPTGVRFHRHRYYRCLWTDTPFSWAFALQLNGRNCSPATEPLPLPLSPPPPAEVIVDAAIVLPLGLSLLAAATSFIWTASPTLN